MANTQTNTNSTTAATDAEQADDPLEAFRSLKIELRSDVQITRQLLRGQPTYVVHDPVSFKTHRLSLSDYSVVSHLRDDVTLQQCFKNAVTDGLLGESHEQDFYQFVGRLHSLGILSIPNYDSKTLYKRNQALTAKKTNPLGILFVSLPLANPDRFLDRTVGRVQFLFSRWMFVVWLITGLASIAIVAARWHDFVTPLNGVLANKSIAFIAAAFIGLKVWHELGHGYACKHFGGRVPEMGAKLIAGFPLAYVDASAAWGFPQRRNRILVMLGGMYFESLVAIPSVFVWAFSGDSLVGSCAYQLIFMAGVATVLFNANPLMKFDGYFVLSDLLGLPNMRQNATQEVKETLCYYVLGLPRKNTRRSRRDRIILFTYGMASSIYSVLLIISISAIVASRFYFLGIAFAGYQLFAMCWDVTRKAWTFLMKSPETDSVRGRAQRVAYTLAAVVPLGLALLPVNTDLKVDGVVSASKETHITVTTPGILEEVYTVVGSEIVSGAPMMRLRNLQAEEDHSVKNAIARRAQLEVTLANNSRLTSLAAKLRPTAHQAVNEAQDASRIRDELLVKSNTTGRITTQVSTRDRGAFLNVGHRLATVVAGETTVRIYLSQEQFQHACVETGQSVNVALVADSSKHFIGTIRNVDQGSTRVVRDQQLTTESDGEIIVNPLTGESVSALYRVEIELPREAAGMLVSGSKATVCISRPYESISVWAYRKTRQFLNKLLLS